MKFKNERELQNWLYQKLKDEGYRVGYEVTDSQGGRCDLTADQYAIECKHYLTTSTVGRAIGQALSYQKTLGLKPVIAGIRPRTEQAWKTAQNDIRRAQGLGIEIWELSSLYPEDFQETQNEFKPVYEVPDFTDIFSPGFRSSYSDVFKSEYLWAIGIVLVALIFLGEMQSTGKQRTAKLNPQQNLREVAPPRTSRSTDSSQLQNATTCVIRGVEAPILQGLEQEFFVNRGNFSIAPSGSDKSVGVRTTWSADGQLIGCLMSGSRVQVQQVVDGWAYIEYRGGTGWVWNALLR
jgi:hypothetical protein